MDTYEKEMDRFDSALIYGRVIKRDVKTDSSVKITLTKEVTCYIVWRNVYLAEEWIDTPIRVFPMDKANAREDAIEAAVEATNEMPA